uniref:Uncharacterized protein n=1 Tax=Anguilla anguilla TaxID=7936 RepID=A0A0E9RV12_ANGAN
MWKLCCCSTTIVPVQYPTVRPIHTLRLVFQQTKPPSSKILCRYLLWSFHARAN